MPLDLTIDEAVKIAPSIRSKLRRQVARMVKAAALKGESKQLLSQVSEAELKEMNDEVDTDRIPRAAMKAVKDYFGTGEEEAPPAPEPAKK